LGNVIFEGNQRWLNQNHPYVIHPNAEHFNGHEELRGRPDIIIAAKVKKPDIIIVAKVKRQAHIT